MADGLNKVYLLGNLGDDPTLRYTGDGTPVLSLRIATTESYQGEHGRKKKTEWHSVVVWGKRGEALDKLLCKGSKLHVEGKLQTRKWEDKNGNTRYTTEIVALNVLLCGGKRPAKAEGETGSTATGDDPTPPPEDDIPF